MNIIIFIVVLSVLVFVHELGHFLFAKITNTKVHSFAIGFQPTLFKRKIGETTYKLNLIPFGGYVRIDGQGGPDSSEGDHSRAFYKKPFWAKLGMMLGGILFNLIFAWLLLSSALMLGTPTLATEKNQDMLTDVANRILMVQPGSVADKAGLKAGDKVISLTFQGQTYQQPTTEDIINLVTSDPTAEFSFTVQTNTMESKEVTITPAPVVGSVRPLLGLSIELLGNQRAPFLSAFTQGFKDLRAMTQDTATAFIGLITQAFQGKADVSTLTGPVGLVGVVGDAASYGVSYLLFFTALISVNLAVLNLVPIPALDGGRVLFILIETISRRKIPSKVANTLDIIGFGLLILLMVSVTVFDVFKLL